MIKKLILASAFVLAIGLASIAGLRSVAYADGSIDWTGQGVENGELEEEDCDEENTPYLLWIFTGNTSTTATITITDDGTTAEGPTAMTQQGQGAFHYTSGFYDLDTIGASVDYDNDPNNPQLVISHGCPGEDRENGDNGDEEENGNGEEEEEENGIVLGGVTKPRWVP